MRDPSVCKRLWLLTPVFGCCLAVGVWAGDTPLHKRVTVQYTGAGVADVLKELEAKSGVRFACPEPLLEGYGNVDDGVPLEPKGALPGARSMGGDEVALMHACFVATLSDRSLYIGDIGNGRIVGVKLGYHANETVGLKKATSPR